MSIHTATSPTWADAASRGTRIERALLAAGAALTGMAVHSAQRRSERRARMQKKCADDAFSFADRERERMRADAVRLGVLRR